MEKRGISVLISTVLIIGFTVVLAVMVIGWSGKFIRETQSGFDAETKGNIDCAKVRFEINSVKCDGELKSVSVSNNGEIDIVGFVFRVRDGNNNLYSITDATGVDSFGSGNVDWKGENVLNPKEVELIPKILDGVVCGSAALEFKVKDC